MKYNGFTLLEVIVAFGLLLTLMLSTIPIIMKVNLEEAILTDRRKVTSILHDELIKKVNDPGVGLLSYSINDFTMINVDFDIKEGLIKACADWANKQNHTEKVCLNGYRKN
ncbi:type II secretion system protein [Thalassobacillus devorans]|uniref:type II secretion system protein n=1 Tax=Thalassobacillus devorans TaxID=279813 RepID=UPI000491DAF2|nr:type II secretion system protein [Thalassobacillus devorans]